MPRDARAYLYDMQKACERISSMTSALDFDAYQADFVLRSAIERQLIIIGEALFVLEKIAPEMASRIPSKNEIIKFRHVLVHGYHSIQDGIVWDVIENDLNALSEALRFERAREDSGQ